MSRKHDKEGVDVREASIQDLRQPGVHKSANLFASSGSNSRAGRKEKEEELQAIHKNNIDR